MSKNDSNCIDNFFTARLFDWMKENFDLLFKNCIVYIIYYNWAHLLNLSTWEMYIKVYKMGNASIMNQ